VQDNLVHKTFVQVFENLWSQGVPFDCCGFAFLSPWSCVFHGCHGFVFLIIAVVLVFFFNHYDLVFIMVAMVLYSS
jgi:hypothetical protein